MDESVACDDVAGSDIGLKTPGGQVNLDDSVHGPNLLQSEQIKAGSLS